MNESKWLTGADGEAMLDLVADRLTPWHWVLLSAAFVRRLWDLLPEGVLRQAVEHAERAAHPLSEAERAEWLRKIDAAIPAAVGAVEMAQREIVKSCDPDAADVQQPILDRPNQIAPAFPLFQAASRNARNAIDGIASALTEAVQAVRVLYSEPAEQMFDLVRTRVEQAIETRTNAYRFTNNALRLKQDGDELADRAASAKNKRLEESIALEKVRKIEEGNRSRGEMDEFEAEERRDRAARKLLAGFVREIVGNPFTPPRFEQAWRTSTAMQLAQNIYDARDFSTMPILADALLDADCDEEPVLRHLRGTELFVKEQATHVRGCWVIELVLGRYRPIPPLKPGEVPRTRRQRFPNDDPDLGDSLDMGEDRLA
jgi:hypothetical protein